MAYTDTVLATTPLRYWPLNETSGTSAAELVASETGTAVGLTMGGGNGPTGGAATDPGGIGGKAPLFTGTQHILLRSAALLGGLSAWTVSAWVYTTMADSNEHVIYGEMSTSAGNDQIRAAIKGPANGPVMSHTYGNDPSIVTKTSGSIFIVGYWSLVHFLWAAGGNVELWWQGGQRNALTGSSSGTTWTNSSIAAWIGGPPRAANGVGFTGSISHLFVHDRKLTAPEMSTLYRAGTPLQRTLLNKTLFKPTSPWNQLLTDPGNVPTVAAGSANMVQRLVNQIAVVGVGTSVGGGPIYQVTNATPTQRVRLQGGQNNFSTGKPDLYDAFGIVPLPTGFRTGVPTDLESAIINTDTDEAWEFWVMAQSLTPVEFLTTSLQTGGAIPPNATQYAWVVYPADAAHAIGPGKSAGAVVTTGNQKVTLSWGTTEGATYYRIYRRLATAGSSGGNFMAEVPAATHSWTDDGSITPGASNTAAATAVTTDWGCYYGGYILDTDLSSGVYEPPHQNWGAAATSLPLYAGVVTVQEMYAGVIPHAITMAVYDTDNTHVYPAQRHDFWGSLTAPAGANNIIEGTRYQLDPTYDVNQLTNPFARMVAKAFQDYGGYVRDHSGAVTGAYVEDVQGLGRNPYPEVMAGKQSYEVFAGFPWSRFQVIDPAWTLAQTTPVSDVTVPFAQFGDDFEDNSIDTNKWTAVNLVTESGGKQHFPIHASPYAKTTTKGGPFSLQGSAVFFKVSQRPYVDLADQSGISIISEVDTTNCKINFWVESPIGVGTGGGLKLTYTNTSLVAVTVNAVILDPVAHAWQRIRESSGVVYAETSADGVTWDPFASFLWSATGWAADALHAVNAALFAGNYNSVPNRPEMVVDSFNVPANPLPPPPPLGEVLVASPADVRVTGLGLANRKVHVLEVTAPADDEYLIPAAQFGLEHIDMLLGPSNVTNITYPASGTSVQFQATPADGVTVPFVVRVMAIGK